MKLTIGILISNRLETVKLCLESVKPLLDSGIAELICVDTVSGTQGLVSDGSAELAKEYTDKVIVFPWIRDFAAARNVTLENATGEWYLYLDDDEWFEDVTPIVQFFQSGEYKGYCTASYPLRNFNNVERTEWTDSTAVRFHKREKGFCFYGRVHETVSQMKLPCKSLDCLCYHTGYIYASEEDKKKHRERNLSLLEKEIEEKPLDMRLRTQMVLELSTFDNEGALKYSEEMLEMFQAEEETPYYQWIMYNVFALYEPLQINFAEAEKKLEEFFDAHKIFESAELCIRFCMVRIHLLGRDTLGALAHFDRYFELLEYLKKNPHVATVQDVANFADYRNDSSLEDMKKWKQECEESLDTLDFNSFRILVSILIENTKSLFEDRLLKRLQERYKEKQPAEYHYLLSKIYETDCRRCANANGNRDKISELFPQSIVFEHDAYHFLQESGSLEGGLAERLSDDIGYNDRMYRFLMRVLDGKEPELSLILEAAKLRPQVVPVLKFWIGLFR